MLFLPITRSWIVSRTARRVYFYCVLASFFLFVLVIGIRATFLAWGVNLLATSSLTAFLVRGSILIMMLGTATLSIAMWYFWFEFDKSGWLAKSAWFIPLYFFLLIGPAFYYLFVYRRNAEVKELG